MGAQVKAPPAVTSALQNAARMMARTVPVPDFYGKTFQQVQAEVARVVPGSQSTMFARVASQGPADGVVASQYPVRDTPVIPGATRLLVTLQAPKPSKFSTFVDQVATALAAPKTYDEQKMVTVPGLPGQTRAVASQKLAVLQLRGSYTGNDAGVVAQQYPVAGESVKPRSVVVVTMALQSVIVPPLYGLSLPEAVRKLQVASLLNGEVYGSSGAGSNVISQSITPGAQGPAGTAVDVTMGYDPPPVTGLHRVWNVVATAVPLAPWWVLLAIALPIGGVGLRVCGRWGGKPTLPT